MERVHASGNVISRVLAVALIALAATQLPAQASDGIEAHGAHDPDYFAHLLDAEHSGSTVYIVGVSGFSIYDVSNPADPVLVGRYQPGGAYYSAAVGATHAYCGARHGGLQTLDVTNPSNPQRVDTIDHDGVQYEGVLLYGDVLYAARHDAGIDVLDVSTPSNPVSLHVITTGVVNAYKFARTGTTLYVADGTGGVKLFDVSVPESPMLVDSISASGVVQDVSYRDGLLAAASGGPGVDIYDATDSDSPIWQGIYDSSSSAFNIDLSNGHLFIADWDDVEVVDLSDPTDPVQVGWEDTPGRVMGLVTDGNMIYVADWDTFRVYEYGAVVNPDIHVSPTAVTFNNVDPGDDDTVVVSVTNTGVSSLNVTGIHMNGSSAFDVDQTPFSALEDETVDLTVTFSPTNGNPQSATLRFVSNDPDESPVTVTLSGNPGTLQVGDVAPDFTLMALDGFPYTLSDFRGNVVVLAFFASW